MRICRTGDRFTKYELLFPDGLATAIYRGEGVGQSVLEIRFSGSWIAQIDQSASAADDRTVMDIVIATTEIHMTAGDDGSDMIMRNQRRWGQVHRET